MEYPKLYTDPIKALQGPHWRLDVQWLESLYATHIPGRDITLPDPSKKQIDDVWEYIQPFDVSPECLSLRLEQDIVMTPLLQMIPHMTALTALELKWSPHSYNKDVPDNMVSKWLGALTASQMNQLQHVSLDFNNCYITTDEIYAWLTQLPHLKSFVVEDYRPAIKGDALQIPPMAELRQLHLKCQIPTHRIELGLMPVLTRLNFMGDGTQINPNWLPNLAKMTSLESLIWNRIDMGDLIEITHHLPTQLENVDLYVNRTGNPLAEAQVNTMWTNLMKLTQLTTLFITLLIPGMFVPDFFVEWVKTSHLVEMPIILSSQPNLAPLLAQVLPEMQYLRSLSVQCTLSSNPPTEIWMAPILQECTQLTQLHINVPLRDASIFIQKLSSLTNLEKLALYCFPTRQLPPDFFSLHFPHLTSFKTLMTLIEPALHKFENWIDRHLELVELQLAFVNLSCFKQYWDIIGKCPTLSAFEIGGVKWEPSFTFTNLPPTLRQLRWNVGAPLYVLPDDHLLDHFQEESYYNNIRRHQTLVDLHTDWLEYFWPL